MQQTRPTDQNRQIFFDHVYPMRLDGADDLVDISKESAPVIVVDCCGWHYAEIFNKPVIMLETLMSAKNYLLGREKFTALIDDRSDILVWPHLILDASPVIVMDRSPLLKYRDLFQIGHVINDISARYDPNKIIVRGSLQFLNDSRIQDRLMPWFDFLKNINHTITRFHYDAENMFYEINLRKIA